jgi:GNAT superfamily N-acetyltransferase
MQICDTDPDSSEALHCLAAYYALLLISIKGLAPESLPLPLPDADRYRAPQGVFLIARAETGPLGCVALRDLGQGVAEVKRLWVDPAARGQGLARRLMATLEARARAIGYHQLKLDSNTVFATAIAMYRADGWQECPAYTGAPADIWLAKSL